MNTQKLDMIGNGKMVVKKKTNSVVKNERISMRNMKIQRIFEVQSANQPQCWKKMDSNELMSNQL